MAEGKVKLSPERLKELRWHISDSFHGNGLMDYCDTMQADVRELLGIVLNQQKLIEQYEDENKIIAPGPRLEKVQWT